MERANAKKYFMISLRVYASPYRLMRWHKHKCMKSYKMHCEAADRYIKFHEKFYERITGNKYDDLFFEYGCAMMDCSIEIIESHGIIMGKGEGWQKILIPLDRTDLIEWVLTNVGEMPYKILKRCRIILDFHRPSTRLRDHFRLSPERTAELTNLMVN